jgi:branched-chain amino acid aminotransferase
MKSIVNGVLLDNENIENWKKKGFVYEVLRVIDSKPLFLKEHLLRMKSTVVNIDIKSIENNLNRLIEAHDFILNNNIFISVNKDNKDIGIFVIKGFYPPEEWYEKGIKINTLQIKRKDPTKKIYDENYKKKIEEHLKQTDVFETLITDEGIINEGSRSNVFFIKDDALFTPSVEAVLPGITRDKVFEAAKACGINIFETSIKSNELNIYDGVFITGTSIDLLPVRQIDNILYLTTNLDCFIKLSAEFENIKNRDLENTDV